MICMILESIQILFVVEEEFTLYVSTGNKDLADTAADVCCNLIGEWGSSGSRLLSKSTNQTPFKQGQVSPRNVIFIELVCHIMISLIISDLLLF